MRTCIQTMLLILATLSVHAAGFYDLEAIMNDPLAAETVKTEVADGIVTEHVLFNGDRDLEGNFIRIPGILVYPEGGKNLPGLLWCQGGMADAMTFFPTLFAKKGYFCLNITLAKKQWNAHGKFDAVNPANANLVRLGIEHLRAVTYLASRPEVDKDRLGVGGASYGGVFATFVAGVDPRIKAGMSFFGAGNHRLGSSLPQFIKLENLDEIAIFDRTFDGGSYMRQRDIPFLWGLPTNDNWFYFPAVVETYRQKPGEKRIAILPHWVHGFPPELDQQIFDWVDIWLKGTRDPYLQPSEIAIERQGDKLIARWSWTGKPTAQRAELVVSYGRVLPWHGWRHRYYHSVPAVIDGTSASAEIPVPEPDLPMLVFGNVWDENQVLVSTLPVEAVPRALGIAAPNASPVTEGSPRGRLEAEDTAILAGTAQGFGRPDPATAHSGSQSVAIDPPKEGAKPRRGRSEVSFMLFNVFERDHRLQVWLKADQPMTVDLVVQGVFPYNWEAPAVRALLAEIPGALPIPAKEDMPRFALAAELTTEWQAFTIDVPWTGVAVEGYTLNLDRRPGAPGTWWIDDVTFQTIWKEAK